jgi:hypothetical protein
MSRKKHEEEQDIVGDVPVEEAPPEDAPADAPEEEPPVEDPPADPPIEDAEIEAEIFEDGPAVDPNTVGGGVPFEADTRTIAEQTAALTPGVG